MLPSKPPKNLLKACDFTLVITHNHFFYEIIIPLLVHYCHHATWALTTH